MTTETKPVAQQAVTELLELARVTRPDINQAQLVGAITDAQNAEWHWPRILTAVAVMLARGEEPRDLVNAITADPTRRYVRKDHQ